LSTLNHTEKRKLEKLLGMETGYVLDFSNRTFAEFITDYSGINIYDSRYDYGSGSKPIDCGSSGRWRMTPPSVS
jgi:hypothetical protein